ncbi:hypothetical protein [Pantoea dispersa]|uniref:hypothetical protein n=1 Tax=Pantoea dispersa TaxID=59814 RepID=UPI00301AD1F1
MKELTKASNYVDNSSDTFVCSGLSVGETDYCRITFVRHILEPKSMPDEGEEINMSFVTEALQSVTLPTSMALKLAEVIQNVAVTQPSQNKGS